MKKCFNCGEENRENAKICKKCGKNLNFKRKLISFVLGGIILFFVIFIIILLVPKEEKNDFEFPEELAQSTKNYKLFSLEMGQEINWTFYDKNEFKKYIIDNQNNKKTYEKYCQYKFVNSINAWIFINVNPGGISIIDANSKKIICDYNELNLEFNKTEAIEALSFKSNPTKIIEFQNQTIENVDKSFCGTSIENLVEIFGKPLYATGWIRDSSGLNVEPSGYKFIFGDYMIFSKGRLNETTKFVETYELFIRVDDENKTVVKLIKC